MDKRWTLEEQPEAQLVLTLANSLNIDQSLAKILAQRNIYNFEKARHFFRPRLAHLHNPFLMKDMQKAINRINMALQNQESILIYGDYDVDGTAAVALIYNFFNQFTEKLSYYVPDRHIEGYGISTQGIDFAKTNGYSLIIALDCGIQSVDKIAYANGLGIDFIICDHHLPGNEIPEAIAVLNPKQDNCAYPFKELSGCGIGFKLAQAYCMHHRLDDCLYKSFLDLCMVSIAADIVPIVDENRILAYFGLQQLNENPCQGLKYLMQITGKKEPYHITDVVFQLAPRINAAGRMGHAHTAVKMLLSKDGLTAEEQSFIVNNQNTDRKNLDQSITEEALAIIGKSDELIKKKTTVVFQENWNKGVIGIVASRLIETYYRPTVVLTASNGKYTGSARSVPGFDLYQALCACSDLLEQFGGHKYAAGLTLKPENLASFTNRFEEAVAKNINPNLLIPDIKIDTEISFHQINDKFYRILAQMAPFGPQNMAPVFLTKPVQIAARPQIMANKHLKLHVMQQNSAIFEAVGFNLAKYAGLIKPNQTFAICYHIEENIWKDKRRIQLNVKDIKLG